MTRRDVFLSGVGFVGAGILVPYLLLLVSGVEPYSRISGLEQLIWINGIPLVFAGCVMMLVTSIKSDICSNGWSWVYGGELSH